MFPKRPDLCFHQAEITAHFNFGNLSLVARSVEVEGASCSECLLGENTTAVRNVRKVRSGY